MRKSLYILGPLSDEDIEWMISYGRRRVVRADELLIRQGEPIEEMYLILEGAFTVTDDVRGGREVARLGRGEIVGEMSFVDARPPSATVTAVADGLVLALSRETLQHKLDHDSGFAARFYRALALFLSDRLRATVSRLGYGDDESLPVNPPPGNEELDPNVLDTVHLAGARFTHIVDRLTRG